jgi:SAM-dependent methyltransferase
LDRSTLVSSRLPDPDHPGVGAFRSALAESGFNNKRIAEAFGVRAESVFPSPGDIPLLRRQLDPGTPLTTLITLFLFAMPVSRDEAVRALAPLNLDAAEEIGLIDEREGAVHCGVRLHPYEGFVFASSPTAEDRAVARDDVMGISASTATLASLTLRRPVERALDLGCGCGVQAVLASRHASRVIATDANPAACRFTAFNARLNDVHNVEVREGNLFEPVADLSFDLIVSNPPYVISPDKAIMYRDSGVEGDELSRHMITETAARLRPGGVATLTISWGRSGQDEWFTRPSQWVSGLGCDALLLHSESQTALVHSASWQAPLQQSDPAAADAAIDRWIEYLQELGFASVGYGVVVLRRRQGENWVHGVDIPAGSLGSASDQLEAMIAAQDRLLGLSLQDLLESRPVLRPNHHLEQTLRSRNGQFAVEKAVMVVDDGLAFRVRVDEFEALLLAHLDGSRNLREAIVATAVLVGDKAQSPDREDGALRFVSQMLGIGLLRFGADPPP